MTHNHSIVADSGQTRSTKGLILEKGERTTIGVATKHSKKGCTTYRKCIIGLKFIYLCPQMDKWFCSKGDQIRGSFNTHNIHIQQKQTNEKKAINDRQYVLKYSSPCLVVIHCISSSSAETVLSEHKNANGHFLN